MSHQSNEHPRPLDAVIRDLEAAIEAWDRPKEQRRMKLTKIIIIRCLNICVNFSEILI